MGKQEIIDKYWLDFLHWNHSTALNQVGNGKFDYPHNDVWCLPTETEFWIWYIKNERTLEK